MHTVWQNVGVAISVISWSMSLSPQKLIESLSVDKNSIRVVAHKKFTDAYLHDDFIAEYDQECDLSSLDPSLAVVPFIMSVISLVWESGETWEIESLDRELALSLDTIKKVYKVFYPSVSWDGQLVVKKMVDNRATFTKNNQGLDPEMASLFSGGLDSLCTSLAHRHKKQLLLTYWGFSPEILLSNPERWQHVQEQCRSYAQDYNHENSFVRSNFRSYIRVKKMHEFYPMMAHWLEHCQESISQVGLAIPLLYMRGIDTMYIPSSRTVTYNYPWGSHPFIDNNIRCGGIRVYHDGYELTRQGKIGLVIKACGQEAGGCPPMFVCRARKHKMCTTCEKCLQTMVGILAEGELPETYGFARSAQRVMNLMRLRIDAQKLRVTHVAIWHWQNIQKRIQEVLADAPRAHGYGPEVREFLLWLCTIDFAKLPHKKPLLRPVNWDMYHYFARQ